MWAFSDESERSGGEMLLAVVLIDPTDLIAARVGLRGLLMAGQRRVHTSDESARRRRVLLDTVARTNGLSAVVWRYRRAFGVHRVEGRQRLLEAACEELAGRGVVAWTLDDMPPTERNRDRNTIGHALRRLGVGQAMVYDHRKSHTEPLLWAADAICWAVGAGGDWRKRVTDIVAVRDLDP